MKHQWVMVTLGVLFGAAIGAFGLNQVVSARGETGKQELRDARHDAAAKDEELVKLRARLDEMQVALERADMALSQSQEQLSNSAVATMAVEPELEEEVVEEAVEESAEATTEDPRERWRQWATPERMEEIRARMDDRVLERWENAEDPAQKERIALFAEHQQHMMDIGMEMGAAEDDETREALREEMMAARDEFNAVVKQEQEKVISGFAKEYGVSDDKSEAFESSLRTMLEDPAFTTRTGRGGWGGGRGGWGGGGGGQRTAQR